MYSIDNIKAILDEVADEVPEAFFQELNGGIILLPDVKYHEPKKSGNGLYILGEYHYDHRGLGRYITIYYGSLMRLYSDMGMAELREKLKEVLLHEFTHHVESLAGVRSLEIKDAKDIRKYLGETD